MAHCNERFSNAPLNMNIRTLKDPVLHSASCALVDFIFSPWLGHPKPITQDLPKFSLSDLDLTFLRTEHLLVPTDAEPCKCNCIAAPKLDSVKTLIDCELMKPS